ncbi:c-type cytochrome [Paenibacillus sp. 481]|uniref:c-type cytochrome n=1 Tax=Paenibacillus sp. 481 TaxID=2835869 RepID=UPI001E533FB5|nr:cytochrome c [Paenibacillus sp. 481]UHA74913.1 cytochrome c [Paenibacillus sp. 481]
MLNKQHRPRFAFVITAIIGLTLVLAGCGGGSSSNKASATIEGPEETVAMYKQRCIQCHGDEMQGRMGDVTNLQKVGARLSKDEIANIIKNGGSRMPAMGKSIEEADINKLAEWLATKK